MQWPKDQGFRHTFPTTLHLETLTYKIKASHTRNHGLCLHNNYIHISEEIYTTATTSQFLYPVSPLAIVMTEYIAGLPVFILKTLIDCLICVINHHLQLHTGALFTH